MVLPPVEPAEEEPVVFVAPVPLPLPVPKVALELEEGAPPAAHPWLIIPTRQMARVARGRGQIILGSLANDLATGESAQVLNVR